MKDLYGSLGVKEKLQRKYEKMYVSVFDDSKIGSVWIANQIAELIREKDQKGEMCVLGLATGSSPVAVYNELVRQHKEENLSFKNVVTFNLDEYYPMEKERIQSYVFFMNEHLFDHIDILPENINIPDGTIDKDEVYDYCSGYEKKIDSYGGIDIQLLGIGRTGHIGFNEPGSGINSPTRLITLDELTKADAAGDFFAQENVPKKAITMGVGTIMKASKIYLMAWGDKKAGIISKAVEGTITDVVPSTYLQYHSDTHIILDPAAAAGLTRFRTPWLVGECNWDDRMIRKAVIWLSGQVEKSILKLTNKHYNDNGLSDLVANHGPAYNINIKIFNDIQHTITGWPGGKPDADDSKKPEREKPFPKRSLVFSPHPDDDVLSMGGTLMRLVEHGNDVHVAYQTSGNISVTDDDVIKYADFVNMYNEAFNYDLIQSKKWYNRVTEFLNKKKPGQIDTPEVLEAKSIIRKGEAKASCRFVGIPQEKIYFLDMPFYKTGTIKKGNLTDKDVQLVVDTLRKVKPNQIFAAGSMSDPHGTHRICLSSIFKAIEIVKNDDWIKDCYVWLYSGATSEWTIPEVDMAVPLSPGELIDKRKAIFIHQTQKDRAMFPGLDEREFWQRSEERNKETAKLYNILGMAEYEAVEVFVRHHI